MLSASATDRPPDIQLNAEGWKLAWDEDWVDPRFLRRGYQPATHDDERYYCRLDPTPRIASRLNSRIVCIAADSVNSIPRAR